MSFFKPAEPTQLTSHLAVDIIVYTASLASTPRAVDPILDKLRSITARLNPGESPHPSDIPQLREVYSRLEDYLANQEPVRTITKDALRHKILQKFQIHSTSLEEFWTSYTQSKDWRGGILAPSPESIAKVRRVRQLGRRIIWVSILVGVAGFFAPAVPSPTQPFSNNFDLAFSLMAGLLMAGAVWLFLRGLAGFTPRLKRVYRLLCAATILAAIAQSQQIVYTYFGLWSTVPFIQRGGVGLGFAPTIALYYAAAYAYARLTGVRGWVKSWQIMLLTCLLVAGLSLLIPFPTALPPDVMPWILPPSLITAIVLSFAALIIIAIKQQSSPAYTTALAWLSVALASGAFVDLSYGIVQTALPLGNAILMYGSASFLFIITGISLVRSAVAFNIITEESP